MGQALKTVGFLKIISDATIWVVYSLEMLNHIPRLLKPSHHVDLYL